jgi:hypothetical protein
MACSMSVTKTLPSPTLPVRATSRDRLYHRLDDAVVDWRPSTCVRGTKSIRYSAPRYTSELAVARAVALHLGDGHALHAELGDRHLEIVQLEGPDDRGDQFHRPSPSLPAGLTQRSGR